MLSIQLSAPIIIKMPHWLKFEAEWLIAGCSAPGTGGAAEFKSEAKSLQCLPPMCLNWDLRIKGLVGLLNHFPQCIPCAAVPL